MSQCYVFLVEPQATLILVAGLVAIVIWKMALCRY